MSPTTSSQQALPAANNEYIPCAAVRHIYGLPLTWIWQLGRPDQIKSHPRDPTKTVSLYARQRVEAFIEARQLAYLHMLVARARKSRPQQAKSCRQVQELIAWARTVEVVISTLPASVTQLKQETEASFLTQLDHGNGQKFVLSEKAMVAYLRHTCTNYHQLLARLRRDPGTTVVYLILKRRVNQALRKRLQRRYGDTLAEGLP
jgi:hypothetical protein